MRLNTGRGRFNRRCTRIAHFNGRLKYCPDKYMYALEGQSRENVDPVTGYFVLYVVHPKPWPLRASIEPFYVTRARHRLGMTGV
jgi:hypothetical protein